MRPKCIPFTDHERQQLKFRIIAAFERCCPGNYETCPIARCAFSHSCAKIEYEGDRLDAMKKHPLKSLLKNITKRENKANGRTNAFHLGYTVAEQAKTILGCEISDHPLFKGDKQAIERAYRCINLAQLIKVFNQQLSNP